MKISKNSTRSKTPVMNKRGFDASQAFMFIATILIVGFVVLFGGKAIIDFLSITEKLDWTQTLKDFHTTYKTVDNQNIGAVRTKLIKLPGAEGKICFIDVSKAVPSPCPPTDSGLTAQICDRWTNQGLNSASGAELENIFILDAKGVIVQTDKAQGLAISNSGKNYLCLSSNAQLKFTSTKDGVAISSS